MINLPIVLTDILRLILHSREEEVLKDKELQRKHEREMMDKQIKLADNLRLVSTFIR